MIAFAPASSIVISSDTALLVVLALLVGAFAIAALKATARAFGVITHSPPSSDSDLRKETDEALAKSEKRILELLERSMPEYAARYVARRSEADDYSLTQAIKIALEVAPENGSSDTEFALALGDLQAQVQKAHTTLAELESRTTANCDQIDTLSARAITPERVTVIASGMAVGLVLLLCAFGTLLVAVLDATSGNPEAGSSDAVQAVGLDQSTGATPKYCVVPVPGGMMITQRGSGGPCKSKN